MAAVTPFLATASSSAVRPTAAEKSRAVALPIRSEASTVPDTANQAVFCRSVSLPLAARAMS